MRLLLIPFYVLSAGSSLINGAGFELLETAEHEFSSFVGGREAVEVINFGLSMGDESIDFKVDESAVGMQTSSKPPFQKKVCKKDIVDVNEEWRLSVRRLMEENGAGLTSKKNTFVFATVIGKSLRIRNPGSLLLEAQKNNLARVVIDEKGRVLLDIPQSSNPSSPTFSRKISIEDFASMEDM
jgi:hypothetical protein